MVFPQTEAEKFLQLKQLKTTQSFDPVWPTNEVRVTQGSGAGHTALDLAAGRDSPIKAVYGGIVEKVITMDSRGYGNLVIIKQSDGTRAYYGHLNGFAVEEGQRIGSGQVIGAAGSTGNSTGPHLHLEFRTPSGAQIDPEKYLDDNWRFTQTPGIQTIKTIGDALPLRGAERLTSSKRVDIKMVDLPKWLPPGLREAVTGEQVTYTDLPAWFPKGLREAISGEDRPPTEEIPWASIAAVGFGFILVILAIAALMKPGVERVVKQVAPTVIGAANPVAAAAAAVVGS